MTHETISAPEQTSKPADGESELNDGLERPLTEQEAFELWCPYTGNPDPRIVWAAATKAEREACEQIADRRSKKAKTIGRMIEGIAISAEIRERSNV